jgi:hypothetical protein
MKKCVVFAAAFAASVSLASMANASVITFTPGDAPVAETPAFGTLAPGGILGTNYTAFGVDFSYGGIEGYFDDVPFEFGGINGSNELDLLSPVDGRIVLQNTTTAATTNYFYAEAGFADVGSLTLNLYDTTMTLLASILNGPPNGVNDRTTFSYSGSGIAFFKIFGDDTFGVAEIRLNTPTLVDGPSQVPVPAALPLLAAGLGALGLAGRRKRRNAAKAAA